MAYSPAENLYLSALTELQFPTPVEQDVMQAEADAGETARMEPVQLAAGPSQTVTDAGPGYGTRPDGTKKGNGWLGPLRAKDGSVMTELTIGVNLDGQEVDIPSIVPTLDRKEIDHLLAGKPPTDAIVDKAVAHAMGRMKMGLSPYADTPSQAGAGRGSYAGYDAAADAASKGPQDEIKAIDPTTRQRLADFLQAGFQGLGMDTYRARKQAETLIGGPNSNLPLDLGLADLVPFLGTALQTEEAVRMGEDAARSAKRGELGTAALQAGGAAVGLVPGGAATAKAVKAAAAAAKKGIK